MLKGHIFILFFRKFNTLIPAKDPVPTAPCPKTNSGVIDAPILKKSVDGKQKMKVDYSKGKQSITHYKVLDKIGSRVAVIALYPKTGRTHQLRVHLEHINAPIVGDRKYMGLPGIYNLSEKLNDHDSITQIKWNSEDINNLAYSLISSSFFALSILLISRRTGVSPFEIGVYKSACFSKEAPSSVRYKNMSASSKVDLTYLFISSCIL